MSLWAKTRSPVAIVLSAASFVVVCFILGNRSAVVPAILGGGSSSIAWSLFLPIVPVVGLIYGLEGRHSQMESRTRRPLWAFDTVVAWIALAVTVGLLLSMAQHARIPTETIRNVGLMGGLGVCLMSWLAATQAAGVLTGLLLITTAYAPANSGAEYVRLFQPEANPTWAMLAMVIAMASIAPSLYLTRRRVVDQ